MKNSYKPIKVLQITVCLLLLMHELHAQYDSGTVIHSDTGSSTFVSVLKNYIIADFDGDNFQDVLLVKDSAPNQLTWFKGDGNGAFIEQNITANIDMADEENDIFYEDMNADGNKDILLQDSGTGFKIYFSDGTGAISSQTDNTVSSISPDEIGLKTVADIDGDSDMDVLLWSEVDYVRHPIIGFNDGNGNFSTYEYLENEDAPIYNLIEVGDMDGDGDLDVFCSGNDATGWAGGEGPQIYLEPFVRWYENLGGGSFAPKQDISLPIIEEILPDFTHIKSNDIDNDGNDELLIEYAIRDECESDLHQAGCVYFYLFHVLDYEEETMSFVPKEEYNSWLHGYTMNQNIFTHEQFYTEAFLLQFGDNDGDGNSDILSINVPQARLQWFYGDGEGGFDNPAIVNSNSEYSSIRPSLRVADIDNDQDLDIFVLINTPTSSTLTVYKNLAPVGIKNLISANEKIALVPNPTAADSYVEISLPSSEWDRALSYTIRNAIEKTVLTGIVDDGKVFISSLSAGIYFVEITAEQERYIGKLVVK